jgi:hypothetical protein
MHMEQAPVVQIGAELPQGGAVLRRGAHDLLRRRRPLDQPLELVQAPVGQAQAQLGLAGRAAQADLGLLELALDRVERLARQALGGHVADAQQREHHGAERQAQAQDRLEPRARPARGARAGRRDGGDGGRCDGRLALGRDPLLEQRRAPAALLLREAQIPQGGQPLRQRALLGAERLALIG